jgi:hypothetical protein
VVVPLAGRVVAAVVGGLLVLVAGASVTETLIVSIERDPAEAWPDFVGWRVNYEAAAYAAAAAVYAVPALWSGPRRHPLSPIPPIRPGRGHPPK